MNDKLLPNGEQIKIDGILYDVVLAYTAEDQEKANRPAIARVMCENKQNRQIYLKRPRGSAVYYTCEFIAKDGTPIYSHVCKMW